MIEAPPAQMFPTLEPGSSPTIRISHILDDIYNFHHISVDLNIWRKWVIKVPVTFLLLITIINVSSGMTFSSSIRLLQFSDLLFIIWVELCSMNTFTAPDWWRPRQDVSRLLSWCLGRRGAFSWFISGDMQLTSSAFSPPSTEGLCQIRSDKRSTFIGPSTGSSQLQLLLSMLGCRRTNVTGV